MCKIMSKKKKFQNVSKCMYEVRKTFAWQSPPQAKIFEGFAPVIALYA